MANVEHSVLTGSDLHEPKGVAAAAANRVYVTNGAGSGSHQQVPAAAIAAAGVLVFQSQFYHSRDERSSGTNGDVMSSGTWVTRTINTEVTDDLSVTTAGNQITLVAGTYFIEVDCVTNFSGTSTRGASQLCTSKLRLRNLTDTLTMVVGQSSRFIHNDDGGGSDQTVDITLYNTMTGRFTIAGSKVFEVQNWVTSALSSSTIRGGKSISSGEDEIYLDVKIWKTA